VFRSLRLTTILLIATLIAATAACSEDGAGPRVEASYDVASGRLIQLSADQDGDGRVDQWTYLDGTQPIRGEKDENNDGRIDRWEYFGPRAELLQVGTSSRGDGIEDTWTFVTPVNGEGRVDVSAARDRHIDRHEYYVDNALQRVELDTNADGLVDRWDRYEQSVLREVQFDTSFSGARADRRLLYDAQGHFIAAEADDDRDGRFERLVPAASVKLPGEPRE
jgi:hypothetical protein